jgi:hypothetical protein
MAFAVILVGLVLVAAVVLLGVVLKLKRRGLPKASAERLRAAMGAAAAQPDAHRRVVEAAKVLDAAFKELGFEGSFADKLRSAQARLGNGQAVWEALKLRNRIAHEVGAAVPEREADAAVKAFSQALKRLC